MSRVASPSRPWRSLVLPPSIAAEIAKQAARAYPCEACGLLIGRDDGDGKAVVTRWSATANVHPEPARNFEVDPAAQISALKDLRDGPAADAGESLLGHVHSHPDAPAIPSDKDKAAVLEADLLWLIVSVTEGQSRAASAWVPREEKPGTMGFDPVAMTGWVDNS